MKNKILIFRFLVPQFIKSLYYFIKFRAKISHKSEVDLTSNIKCGTDFVVSSFTKLKAYYGIFKVGNRCGFGPGCFISTGEGGIEIGDNFICGPNVNIVARNYGYNKKNIHLDDLERKSVGIKIGNNVWIGAGSSILDGSVICDNTIVVANSLVNRRYPPDVILQGSPAKIIFKR